MIGLLEFPSKPSKHFANSEVVLMVSVETGRIKDDRSVAHLASVATPEVAMQKGRRDLNVGEEGRQSGPEAGPERVKLRIILQVNLLLQLNIYNKLWV